MQFFADLHLHSKYSRATSRDCDLEHLALWARKKGIAVLGTGDFTHPAWLQEIRDKLIPAETGLFRLREELERWTVEQAGAGEPTRFMLQVEISTIYKKAERTRKIHHLIYVPDLDAAEALVAKLSRIGNLASDGRPILGLDSRDLLEIALECGDGVYLVPAHIWTPWFAVLGSKSGFDSVNACYGDLADHIFAVETGLSSDPPMNWRLSALDRYTLVSNSDAHSPPKLGREACVFDTDMDYFAIRRALETGEGYGGTVEFFPDEGKYHLDGHRKCGVRLHPAETRRHGGNCPVCGKPVTVGVLHRVDHLADRAAEERPERTALYSSLVPLNEVLAEIQGVGPGSKRVRQIYEGLLSRIGPELYILQQATLEEIRDQGSSLLAEALARMRAGKVRREAGYDGEYGVIRLFEPREIAARSSVGLLFEAGPGSPERSQTEERSALSTAAFHDAIDKEDAARSRAVPATSEAVEGKVGPCQTGLFHDTPCDQFLATLDTEQRQAAMVTEHPLLILAGPGTGKTRTLTHRIAHLVGERRVEPAHCLALTFTRRAAEEMRHRLNALLGDSAAQIAVLTFHGLGWRILREYGHRLGLPPEFSIADEAMQCRVVAETSGCSLSDASRRLKVIARARLAAEIGSELADEVARYRDTLHQLARVDLDDLIELPLGLFENNPDAAAELRRRYRWISVDEYQDVDARQYRLIRLLTTGAKGRLESNLCAIGDPDQAIYGFRGADVSFFLRFAEDFPGAHIVRLKRNYRSERAIVDASLQVVARSSLVRERGLEALRDGAMRITLHEASSERAEAELVVHSMERMLGGHSFFSLDSGRSEGDAGGEYGFSDFAVLYRVEAQAAALEEALQRSGIPFQRRSHRRVAQRELVRWLEAHLQRPAGKATLRQRLESCLAATGDPDCPAALAEAEWLLAIADQCADSVDELLAQVAVTVEVDTWDPRADRVSLLTLHAAKGLEFPVVWIVGCEDGLLPLRRSPAPDDSPDLASIEEERRLLFVGMTRARDRLLLTRARRRSLWGKRYETSPSPFLRDIEERLLEVRRSETKARRETQQDPQLKLL